MKTPRIAFGNSGVESEAYFCAARKNSERSPHQGKGIRLKRIHDANVKITRKMDGEMIYGAYESLSANVEKSKADLSASVTSGTTMAKILKIIKRPKTASTVKIYGERLNIIDPSIKRLWDAIRDK